jgi:hypothetical protein
MEFKYYTKPLSGLNNLTQKINDINIRIDNFSKNVSVSKITNIEWKINRLSWYKNRYVFYCIYIVKKVSKKILSFLDSNYFIDSNLIRIWKQSKFRNLCSINVFLNDKMNNVSNKSCRIPLCLRKSTGLLFAQKLTGCICCATIYGIKQPIWWDSENKIRQIFDLRIYEKNLNANILINVIIKKFLFNYKWIKFEKISKKVAFFKKSQEKRFKISKIYSSDFNINLIICRINSIFFYIYKIILKYKTNIKISSIIF